MLGVQWSQGIEGAWSNVAAFVPALIGCLLHGRRYDREPMDPTVRFRTRR